jgi:hypothetical protein
MGLLDRFKKHTDKAKDVVVDNADKIDEGTDKAADFADDKTGGKHTEKIDKAADTAKAAVDKLEGAAKKDDTA